MRLKIFMITVLGSDESLCGAHQGIQASSSPVAVPGFCIWKMIGAAVLRSFSADRDLKAGSADAVYAASLA